MNSFRQSRRGHRGLWFATLLVVVILVFDWFSGGTARAKARAVAAGVSSVATVALSRVAESGFFSSRAGLARDNASLRDELSRLREEVARVRALEEENAALRELAALSESAEGVTAPITSSFRASPYGTFTIGGGSADGIRKGATVLTSGGFLLGVVSDVGEKHATVRALFAPGVETDVLIGETPALLQGKGGGNAFARVSRGASVKTGDAVVAPSLGQRAIGIVEFIERDEASPSADVYVRFPVNLETLRFVFVEL